MQYKRMDIKGGCYFFTVNLANRKSTLLIDHIESLKHAINQVKQNHPFIMDAMVILPEHLHAIWTLPQNDSDYAKRWMLIKSTFSRSIPKREHISKSKLRRRERGNWQRRYWEHAIKDDQDLQQHINYIHHNPVKHGHVNNPTDWPHSTIHHFIETGRLEPSWCHEAEPIEINSGEPK